MDFLELLVKAYSGYANYFVSLLINPFKGGINPFYFLILASLFVWTLEITWPWRKKQKVIRKDFWLDAFYMFFNYFFFNLLIFAALSSTTGYLFANLMNTIGLPKDHLIDFIPAFPAWARVIVFFLIYDFVQWSVHNALHRVPFLWRFHRVHHSVTEMGFAAHLRYHFMENIFYRLALYIVLSYVLNISLPSIAWLYAATTLIGHLNHANFKLNYGPLKYVLNSQRNHIWHHAKELPQDFPKGMNFAISLSIWDYLFGTYYEPFDGRDIPLGFENVEEFPEGFIAQQVEAFKKR